jgi:hypothetical protein
MLIDIWKRQQGRLPDSQHELYRLGCIALCEEQNESRRSSRRVGTLAPDERFAMATRIAALTMFSNRAAVWLGQRSEQPESDLGLHQIAVGSIEMNGRSVAVTEKNLREVIGTGLLHLKEHTEWGGHISRLPSFGRRNLLARVVSLTCERAICFFIL